MSATIEGRLMLRHGLNYKSAREITIEVRNRLGLELHESTDELEAACAVAIKESLVDKTDTEQRNDIADVETNPSKPSPVDELEAASVATSEQSQTVDKMEIEERNDTPEIENNPSDKSTMTNRVEPDHQAPPVFASEGESRMGGGAVPDKQTSPQVSSSDKEDDESHIDVILLTREELEENDSQSTMEVCQNEPEEECDGCQGSLAASVEEPRPKPTKGVVDEDCTNTTEASTIVPGVPSVIYLFVKKERSKKTPLQRLIKKGFRFRKQDRLDEDSEEVYKKTLLSI